MSAIIRNDFPALMARGLDLLFEEALGEIPEQFGQIFDIQKGEGAFRTELGLVGMGGPGLKAELEPIRFDKPRQGRPITYIFNTFALGVALSFESKADDRYGKIASSIGPELARVFKVEREQQAADIFNYAFTVRGYEPEKSPARSLISNDHRLVRPAYGVSSVSNAITGALSHSALNSGRVLGRKNRTESGKKEPLIYKYLVVGPSNQTLAEELVLSSMKPGQFTGGTQPNDINVFNRTNKLEVVVWDWIEDDGRWFLLTEKQMRRLKWFDREKLNTDYDVDKQTRSLLYMAFARWACGFSDWRGVAGSPGS